MMKNSGFKIGFRRLINQIIPETFLIKNIGFSFDTSFNCSIFS